MICSCLYPPRQRATDDSLTEYLQAAALAYQAETGTHVTLKEVSGVDYLEQINARNEILDEQDRLDAQLEADGIKDRK